MLSRRLATLMARNHGERMSAEASRSREEVALHRPRRMAEPDGRRHARLAAVSVPRGGALLFGGARLPAHAAVGVLRNHKHGAQGRSRPPQRSCVCGPRKRVVLTVAFVSPSENPRADTRTPRTGGSISADCPRGDAWTVGGRTASSGRDGDVPTGAVRALRKNVRARATSASSTSVSSRFVASFTLAPEARKEPGLGDIDRLACARATASSSAKDGARKNDDRWLGPIDPSPPELCPEPRPDRSSESVPARGRAKDGVVAPGLPLPARILPLRIRRSPLGDASAPGSSKAPLKAVSLTARGDVCSTSSAGSGAAAALALRSGAGGAGGASAKSLARPLDKKASSAGGTAGGAADAAVTAIGPTGRSQSSLATGKLGAASGSGKLDPVWLSDRTPVG